MCIQKNFNVLLFYKVTSNTRDNNSAITMMFPKPLIKCVLMTLHSSEVGLKYKRAKKDYNDAYLVSGACQLGVGACCPGPSAPSSHPPSPPSPPFPPQAPWSLLLTLETSKAAKKEQGGIHQIRSYLVKYLCYICS